VLPPPDNVTEEAFAVIRRSLQAAAVAMLAVPVLAGCEAGLNAPTLQFHPASNGAHAVINGITINNAFVLAAPSGSSLPPGSQAGLFLGLWNNGSGNDSLTGVSVPSQVASSAAITGGTVALPPNTGANLTGPTPEIVLNGLAQPLSGGQDVDVILTFQNAGSVGLEVPVEPQSFYYSTLSQPPSPTPTPTPTATATTPAAHPTSTAKPKAKPTATAKPKK
jgi:copper(I)-binding protein